MVLVQKWPFFPILFLGNIGEENVFDDILERKKAFLGYIKKQVEEAEKFNIFPWFWSKNGHFSKLFFLANIRQENVFYDILKRKNAFLGFKNKKFKKSKN